MSYGGKIGVIAAPPPLAVLPEAHARNEILDEFILGNEIVCVTKI